MAESWELITGDDRQEDQLPTYIIYCEDQNHEPAYFNSFGRQGVLKINTIPNQKQGKLNLNNTIAGGLADGLIVFTAGAYRVNPGIDQKLWCVYDRDLENDDPAQLRPADHIDFDTAIQVAQDAGLSVAWSNDAFELWILLHFEMVPFHVPFHRDIIYERLTAVFIGLPDKSAGLTALVAHQQFTYRYSLKKKLPFVLHVLPLLPQRQAIAIQRAKELVNNFGHHVAYHLRNPCTMAYSLVEELQAIIDLA